MPRLPGYFELVLWSLTKNLIAADIIIFWIISDDFYLIAIMVCCGYSLESPEIASVRRF